MMRHKTEDIRPQTQYAGRNTQDTRRASGSALILAVVLTSLLAIVGVIFLLSSRVDSVATSAIADNKDLNLAVDTVIARMSEELSRDVPGVGPGGEYYDYPGDADRWLASLEPNSMGLWPHITDVSNQLGVLAYNLIPEIIPDYQPAVAAGNPADADGDGVSDSMWVQVLDKYSSKGKPVYAAIRIIDNSAMLNVNTGYKFDPCDVNPQNVDGSSQMQIDLLALAALDNWHTLPGEKEARLLSYRCGYASANFYEQNVVWQYGLPAGAYTPFDISDELVLRNRYILNNDQMTTRIEDLWTNAFKGGLEVPRNTTIDDENWTWVVYNSYPALCPDPCVYDYRHIATTQNLDRIIGPSGGKMFNINLAPDIHENDPNGDIVGLRIRDALLDGRLLSDWPEANGLSAQIAANLIDYRDEDSNVAVVYDGDGIPHFGFEQPCIYISEIVTSFERQSEDEVATSYAIELYNPERDIMEPNDKWQLLISGGGPNDITIPVTWPDNNAFQVIWNVNPKVPLPQDPNADPNVIEIEEPNLGFIGGSLASLQRYVNGFGFITADSAAFPEIKEPNVEDFNLFTYKLQRDISPHKCIRRLWNFSIDELLSLPTPPMSLGGYNYFISSDADVIQAHPANQRFTNVGQFGELFYANTYAYGGIPLPIIPPPLTEPRLRINLADPNFQQVFKYLTVFDPNEPRYGGHPYDETRIKGRININTAPWFVIAQLPWVTNGTPSYGLAQAIVAYRDKLILRDISDPNIIIANYGNRTTATGSPLLLRENYGFASIGELTTVTNTTGYPLYDIRKYADPGSSDMGSLPDLTPNDGAANDFEERDVIFARISDLVTVRSDVFTAYILVRVGEYGPQKRVVAILDRSGVVPNPNYNPPVNPFPYIGDVNCVSVQQVPDPR